MFVLLGYVRRDTLPNSLYLAFASIKFSAERWAVRCTGLTFNPFVICCISVCNYVLLFSLNSFLLTYVSIVLKYLPVLYYNSVMSSQFDQVLYLNLEQSRFWSKLNKLKSSFGITKHLISNFCYIMKTMYTVCTISEI